MVNGQSVAPSSARRKTKKLASYGVAVALVLVLSAALQLLMAPPADAQDAAVDKPILSVEGDGTNTVTFEWVTDPDATSYDVFASDGTTCTTVTLSSATCNGTAGMPLCVSVQGRIVSRHFFPSSWLCGLVECRQ